jgi:MFS family permease
VGSDLRGLLRNRDFALYWSGVVLSEIGLRGTFVVNLYHVYALTGSTALVGIVGVVQGVSVVTLSPLGGAIADRLDRRRLLQCTQSLSMLASLTLGVLSITGVVTAWHIYLAVLVNTVASTFDSPARTALIPSLVPERQLAQAFAIVNPTRELAILVGPAIGGALIAVAGPGAMYLLDAGTYLILVILLPFLRVPPLPSDAREIAVWSSIRQGASFVRRRPLIWQLMSLDLSTTVLAGWRVVLPALAVDVLRVGEAAYGLLAAAPSAGALIGTAIIVRYGERAMTGNLVLVATAAYGGACIALAQSPNLLLAMAAGLSIGGTDALASVVRHAAVQLETPDALRGRVTSLYQVAVRGGPAVGDANVGWVSAFIGPVAALSLGGFVPMFVAGAYALWGTRVRRYRLAT